MRGHARRVGFYASLLADRLNLSAQEHEHLRIAAFLHDLGKVGVPTDLLLRPAALDASDRSLVEAHAARLAPIGLPVVQIHGEWDQIIPLEYGVAFHEQLNTREKQLVIIPGAGHNDIGWVGQERYFETLARFISGGREEAE